MVTRKAECACGELSITVSGDPHQVFRCHCDSCQKRTGSAFQVSAWFNDDQVIETTGTPKVFNKENGMGTDWKFCTQCGTTVYWEADFIPGVVCVAVGCFVDADFPMPTLDIQTQYRHGWIEPIEGVPEFEQWWVPPEFP